MFYARVLISHTILGDTKVKVCPKNKISFYLVFETYSLWLYDYLVDWKQSKKEILKKNFFFSKTFTLDISAWCPVNVAIHKWFNASYTRPVLSADAVAIYWPVESKITSSTSSSCPRNVPTHSPIKSEKLKLNQIELIFFFTR